MNYVTQAISKEVNELKQKTAGKALWGTEENGIFPTHPFVLKDYCLKFSSY